MSTDVLADIEWFRRERGAGEPIVLTLYHGTTHEFANFDGTRTNMENMFGRQVYFTSCEDDAERNYASLDGPDLKNRIEHHAEMLMNDDEDLDEADARQRAREQLYGGHEAVLTVEVSLRNPLVLGENKPHIVVKSLDDLYAEACERVARDEGIDLDELYEDLDEYDDLISESMDAMTEQAFSDFEEKVSAALENTGMISAQSDAVSELYQLFAENTTAEEIFALLERDERFIYLFESETGLHNVKPVVSEIFHLSGHDAIVLLDASSACRNMDMRFGTSHVALSLDCLDQIRILDRRDLSASAECSLDL